VPPKSLILPGQRFGRWTVIDPERHCGTDGWRARKRAAECRCDCGEVRVVSLATLTNGTSLSCGCLQREHASAWSRVPGNIAPMLNAHVDPSPEQKARSAARFRSPEHRARVSAAVTTHGLSRHPLYGTWKKMRRRCEVPELKDYPSYGGRGITVCAEWQTVTGFITWIEANLGPRPIGASLDRIDADGNYEPGNVRWASSAVQVANRRQAAWLSDRHWRVIFAALSESGSPGAAETLEALAAQVVTDDKANDAPLALDDVREG